MIGILGGGLSGLCTSYFLDRENVEILEKNPENGGLCRSLTENGFTFDFGGSHILFSKNPETMDFIRELLKDKLYKQKRNTKIFYKGRLVKYPFENGLHLLPKEDNFHCLSGFLDVVNNKEKLPSPANLKEWFHNTFGTGICEKYLYPYNEKIWNFPLHKMDFHWVERIPQPPVDDVIKSSLGIETEGYTHQLYFYYPKQGGIQTLIKELESRTKAKQSKNFEVKSIKKSNGKLIINDGEREYDDLISTLPVPVLFSCLENVPQEVLNAVNNLHYNSLISVMIGVKKPRINDISWMYFPREDEGWFNRLSFPFNFSPEVVPENHSSVLAEITCYGENEIWKKTDEEIINQTIAQLQQNGIVSKDDVCFTKIKRSRYAYIIYDSDYHKNMEIIRNYLNDIGIKYVGRFAEWSYMNMDAVIEAARKFVDKYRRND